MAASYDGGGWEYGEEPISRGGKGGGPLNVGDEGLLVSPSETSQQNLVRNCCLSTTLVYGNRDADRCFRREREYWNPGCQRVLDVLLAKAVRPPTDLPAPRVPLLNDGFSPLV